MLVASSPIVTRYGGRRPWCLEGPAAGSKPQEKRAAPPLLTHDSSSGVSRGRAEVQATKTDNVV